MRRNKTLKRGRVIQFRVVPILLAGGIGYVIGGANITALRATADVSATDAIALRFPSDWNNPSPQTAIAVPPAAFTVSVKGATNDAQLALLNPQPMVSPPMVSPPASHAVTAAQATPDAAAQPAQNQTTVVVQTAALEQPLAVSAPDAPVQALARSKATAAPQPPAPRHHVVNRPGYMLDDAQIASIKERLRLTPDQEQMWAAVEAALRNMHYTHVQEARLHGTPTDNNQVAVVDQDSVQGLKSAAVPLIMSFNTEQKEEVRNVAHVMGLDQLATQF
jgi:hypothetical protein